MIRILPTDEIPWLYNTHIVRDFSADEQRPLMAIRSLARKGYYTCYALEEADAMVAYACLIRVPDARGALLDYFAVAPDKRSGGIGSRFLAALRDICDADGIVIESGLPEGAADEDERDIRKRRVAFYERNGASLSDVGWYAFSVDYNLLWLPIRAPLEAIDMAGEIQRIYAHTTPSLILRTATRAYSLAPDGPEGR